MPQPLILASGSSVRRALLQNANVPLEVQPARVDEASARAAMLDEGAGPRDLADGLAEMKARRGAGRAPGRLVLGCDQVLEHDGATMTKPETRDAARDQLMALRGRRHSLLSAAVIYDDGEPVWRHVGVARLTMRAFNADYLDAYLDRTWPDIAETVGGYKLEGEGVRLFARIEGDYFTILGLPLLEILGYLTLRGEIDG